MIFKFNNSKTNSIGEAWYSLWFQASLECSRMSPLWIRRDNITEKRAYRVERKVDSFLRCI